jgi:hypothetical protein
MDDRHGRRALRPAPIAVRVDGARPPARILDGGDASAEALGLQPCVDAGEEPQRERGWVWGVAGSAERVEARFFDEDWAGFYTPANAAAVFVILRR